MVETNKTVFLHALIVTLVFFFIGIVIGFSIESNRVDFAQSALFEAEISTLDEQIQNINVEIFDVDCETAKAQTFSFADRIYEDVLLLEEYDSSSKFTDELRTAHKKYDLLRMLLWSRSIEHRERCESDFHTIVYMFEYGTEDADKEAVQLSYSRLLRDFKNNYQEDVLLIPLAANLDLQSIEMLKEMYGVTQLPVVIVDENKMIYDLPTYEELEKIVLEKDDFRELERERFVNIGFARG